MSIDDHTPVSAPEAEPIPDPGLPPHTWRPTDVDERATNPRRAAEYMASPGTPAEVVTISAAEMAADRVWLGLRTSDGVEESALPTQIVRFLLDAGLAERRAGRICPSLRGFLMADRIAARVVEAL